jgi:hypothetical protein
MYHMKAQTREIAAVNLEPDDENKK